MIVVTGGTGFIGSHVLDRLAASGEPVRALTRRGLEAGPAGRPATPTIEWVRAGPGSGQRLEPALEYALDGATAVIHLAGVTKAFRPADYYSGNTQLTETLVRAAARRNLRFVHVSSLAAVGPSPDGIPLREDAVPAPVSDYGKSKLQAEQIVRSLLPAAVIVRPPVVYGPRDTDVFRLLKSISGGLVLEIAGGPRWFSAIYVADLVEGILLCARSLQAEGRTYFLAHPKASTWSELATVAGRVLQRRARVMRVPFPLAYAIGCCAEIGSRLARRPGILSRGKIAEARCRYWICDHRRAAAELGFRAPTSLEHGLAKAIAWYKEAGWLKK